MVKAKTKAKAGRRALEAAVGVAVGAINGLLGGGGGMLCVPFLENILGEEVKVSHATTVLVIFPVCLAAAAVYTAKGETDPLSALLVAAGAVVGGALGSAALAGAPPKAVAVVFALIVAGAGAWTVWKG